MIERLKVFATYLLPFRVLLVMIAVLSSGVLLLSVLDDPWSLGDELLLPSILCFTWSVTLLSFSGMFAHFPQLPAAKAGWRARLLYKIRATTLMLLALTFVALCAALVLLTYQLLRVGGVG